MCPKHFSTCEVVADGEQDRHRLLGIQHVLAVVGEAVLEPLMSEHTTLTGPLEPLPKSVPSSMSEKLGTAHVMTCPEHFQ